MTSGESLQLGRYKILEQLGAGNYAVVYKAQDELLGRIVALKVLKDEFSGDQELVQRFIREARAMANLMHPHIAWVLDMGQVDGKHFLAMRYIDGISLDQAILRQGKLPWSEAIKITGEIGEALDFAHSKGIIHRDVKPKNIILGQKDGAVLTDFGFVKATYDSSFLTGTGAIIGTPQYIPPEIWRNEPATPASDQYSLACVFVEMLEGRPLFEGKGLDVIMRKHLKSPDIWDTWSSGVPADIEATIRRALAQDPCDRFPDNKSFVTALSQTSEIEKTMIQPRRASAEEPVDIKTGVLAPPVSQPITPVEMLPPTAQQIQELRNDDQLATLKLDQAEQRPKGGFFKRFQKAVTPSKPPLGMRLPAGEIITLDKDGQITIGRGEGCEVVIESLGVSRQHACIVISNGIVTIDDLNSRNGTFVNNKRIEKTVKLNGGEKISLGKNVTLEVIVIK
jgi:serine/threonine protein kinase